MKFRLCERRAPPFRRGSSVLVAAYLSEGVHTEQTATVDPQVTCRGQKSQRFAEKPPPFGAG